MENICYTGGAEGADTLFGQHAKAAGHKVVHYGFEGQKSSEKITYLTSFYLREADPYLAEANKILKRTFPSTSSYTNNLLRRNYWQVCGTDRVYAVTALDENGIPKGGTAWALIMAMIINVPEIYVFDKKWHTSPRFINETIRWDDVYFPPYPEGKYTGIGSRKLNTDGIKAIGNLYDGNN